jgi:radical SAM protein with 4Fe4S-binding SPASM domain
LPYFGDENVLCFADGNPQKIGLNYFGKQVISYAQMLETAKESDVQIVLSLQNYSEVKSKLISDGIEKVVVFNPGQVDAVKNILEDLTGKTYKNVVAIGDGLSEKSSIEFGGANVVVCTNINEALLCDADCYITANIETHLADYERLRQSTSSAIYDLYRRQRFYPADKLIFDTWQTTETEPDYISRNVNSVKFAAISDYVSEAIKTPPLFEYVEIETVNRCNGLCSFCPVNIRADTRTHTLMDELLFRSIIGQLKDLNYSGFLSLFSNNEPFLDNRIIDFCKYTREMLPNAHSHLWTNGTLLTVDKYKAIILHLDELIIDNYADDMQLIKPVKAVADYIGNDKDLIAKTTIVLRKQNQILSSRGGSAPNRSLMPECGEQTCVYPFKQLVIRPTGEISLCCNDPLGKYTLGDLRKQAITEVWYGGSFKKIRNLIAAGRKNLEACKHCDVFFLP